MDVRDGVMAITSTHDVDTNNTVHGCSPIYLAALSIINWFSSPVRMEFYCFSHKLQPFHMPFLPHTSHACCHQEGSRNLILDRSWASCDCIDGTGNPFSEYISHQQHEEEWFENVALHSNTRVNTHHKYASNHDQSNLPVVWHWLALMVSRGAKEERGT